MEEAPAQNPITEPVVSTTPPDAKPKHRIPIWLKVLALAVVIILTIILFTGAYILSKNPATKSAEIVTPTVTPAPKPVSNTTNATANWKTYSNKELGISFKYSPNLGIASASGVTIYIKSSNYSGANDSNNYKPQGQMYTIEMLDYSPGMRPAGSNNLNKSLIPASLKLPNGFYDIYVDTYAYPNNTIYGESIVFYPKNKDLYYGYNIGCETNSTGIQTCEQNIYQILSTIKVNPVKKPPLINLSDISNWKTYVDKDNHFSYLYPENGIIDDKQKNYITSDKYADISQIYVFSITVEKNTDHLTIDQLTNKYSKNNPMPYDNGQIKGIKIYNGSKVIMVNDETLYTFNLDDGNSGISTFDAKLLDKILSTFKFFQ